MRNSYDPHIAENLIRLVGEGNYVSVACRAAGISKTTYFRWLEQGAAYCEAEAAGKKPIADHKVFVGFRRRIEAARAQAECDAIRKIRDAGEKDWKSLAWLLERRYKQRWGTKAADTSSVSSPDSGVREAQTRINSDPALAGDIARLADSLSGKLGK
jgi:hypothetical protein